MSEENSDDDLIELSEEGRIDEEERIAMEKLDERESIADLSDEEIADIELIKMEEEQERKRLMEFLSDDFVETWKLFLDYKTDAHWSFKEITGLYLISIIAFFNWRMFDLARIPITSGENYGGMWLNLWIIMLGESRIARKSTVIKATREIVRELTYHQDVQVGDDGTETINMILPHEFNPASFVQIMNQREVNGMCYATWIDDEVSRFYEQMAGATYMSGIAPALSRLYDPEEGYERATIARGTERIRRSYLTILTASTLTLPQLFSEREIMQGFLNRFIFMMDNLDEREDRRADRNTKIEVELTHDVLKKKMLKWLKVVRDAPPYWLILEYDSPAKEFYDKYEKKTNEIIRTGDINELYRGYVGNMPDFLLKIASLYRISRTPYFRLKSEETGYYDSEVALTIGLEDLERSKKMVDLIFENFKKVVRLSRKKIVLGVTRTQDSDLITVWEAIEKKGRKKTGSWATRSDVLISTKMKTKQLESVLGALIETECIERKWGISKGAGRKPELLRALKPPI